MKVWIRIWATISTADGAGDMVTCEPTLEISLVSVTHIAVYPSQAAAEHGRITCGGIIFEIDAASLKGMGEFGEDVSLDLETSEFHPVKAALTGFITVDYSSLEHWHVPNEQGGEDDFGADAHVWFTQLEAETGFSLHQ